MPISMQIDHTFLLKTSNMYDSNMEKGKVLLKSSQIWVAGNILISVLVLTCVYISGKMTWFHLSDLALLFPAGKWNIWGCI